MAWGDRLFRAPTPNTYNTANSITSRIDAQIYPAALPTPAKRILPASCPAAEKCCVTKNVRPRHARLPLALGWSYLSGHSRKLGQRPERGPHVAKVDRRGRRGNGRPALRGWCRSPRRHWLVPLRHVCCPRFFRCLGGDSTVAGAGRSAMRLPPERRFCATIFQGSGRSSKSTSSDISSAFAIFRTVSI